MYIVQVLHAIYSVNCGLHVLRYIYYCDSSSERLMRFLDFCKVRLYILFYTLTFYTTTYINYPIQIILPLFYLFSQFSYNLMNSSNASFSYSWGLDSSHKRKNVQHICIQTISIHHFDQQNAFYTFKRGIHVHFIVQSKYSFGLSLFFCNVTKSFFK